MSILRSVPLSLFVERRGRRRLAEDAERRGRVSSTPLRGCDTTPRRQGPVKFFPSKSASATSAFSVLPMPSGNIAFFIIHKNTRKVIFYDFVYSVD